MDKPKTLVVIPSEPLHLYEKKGIHTWLERYYNPEGYFDEVYLVSPLEVATGHKYGMEIIPVTSGTHFRKVIKELQPLCVRTYGAYWATSYGVINKVKGIPVVASIHDPNPAYIFKGIQRASFIFSMSASLSKILRDMKIDESRIIESGNRVDFELFRKMDKAEPQVQELRSRYPEGIMLLHVGRISEEKNLTTTVGALHYLPENHFLVIIGRGGMVALNQHIKDLNLSHRIFMVPSVPNNELPYWFNACDVFVTPSLWEGFGVVFLEAAACQTRIVTSDISPLNTFLKDDGNTVSLIEDYKNSKALSEGIQSILKEGGSSQLTYEFIKNRYSVEAIEKIEIDFYNKLLSENHTTSYTDSYIGRKIYAVEHTLAQTSEHWRKRIKRSTKLKKLKSIFKIKR